MTEAEKLLNSLEEACSKKELVTVELLIQKLKELSKKDENVNSLYSQAVVKTIETFQSRLSTIKVTTLLKNVEELVKNYPKNKDLVIYYAKALRHSLLAIKTKGQPNTMKDIITNLEGLAEINPDNIAIQEELSEASYEIIGYWKSRGDFKLLRERTSKFRELAEKYPDNENIKLLLSKSLIQEIDSSNKYDVKNVDNLLLEIQQLSESMPANEGLQLEWVHAYRTAMDRMMEKPEDADRWLHSMKEIASSQKDDAFKLELAMGYLNAISTIGTQNIEETKKHLDELELLAETSKNNPELQTLYAQSLIISLQILGLSDFEQSKDNLAELKTLVNSYPNNTEMLEIYVESLIGVLGLLIQAQKAEEMTQLVELLEELDKNYPDNQFIQETYNQISSTLKMIGYKKTKKKNRIDYV